MGSIDDDASGVWLDIDWRRDPDSVCLVLFLMHVSRKTEAAQAVKSRLRRVGSMRSASNVGIVVQPMMPARFGDIREIHRRLDGVFLDIRESVCWSETV